MGTTVTPFYHFGRSRSAMDFYFPGTGKSGDPAPRKDFADKWHLRAQPELVPPGQTILACAYAIRLPQLKSSVFPYGRQAHLCPRTSWSTLTAQPDGMKKNPGLTPTCCPT